MRPGAPAGASTPPPTPPGAHRHRAAHLPPAPEPSPTSSSTERGVYGCGARRGSFSEHSTLTVSPRVEERGRSDARERRGGCRGLGLSWKYCLSVNSQTTDRVPFSHRIRTKSKLEQIRWRKPLRRFCSAAASARTLYAARCLRRSIISAYAPHNTAQPSFSVMTALVWSLAAWFSGSPEELKDTLRMKAMRCASAGARQRCLQ